MKPVTHLTSKERIYNPPVQMKRLNLSSNRLIFSTELHGRTEVSFIGARFESHRLGILSFLSAFQLKSATCRIEEELQAAGIKEDADAGQY